MAPPPQFNSFEAFWAYYLGEHESETNRRLHVLGTSAALATAALALLRRKPLLLALVPLIGYGPAWVGHFLVEGNRPATFRHPLWSLRADLRLTARALTGRLADTAPQTPDVLC